MMTSQVIRSLAILLSLTISGSMGNEGAQSEVGMVPEHHQANSDGTVTDLGPQQFHSPSGMPQPQPQPQQSGPNGPSYGPQPGFNPMMGQGMQGPQVMMPGNTGPAYGAPLPFPSYGPAGSNGMNGGYRQTPGMYNNAPMQSPATGFTGQMMPQPQQQQQQPAFNPAAGLAAQYAGQQGGQVVDPMMAMVSGKMMYAPAMNQGAGGVGQQGPAAGGAGGEFRGLDSAPFYRRRR